MRGAWAGWIAGALVVLAVGCGENSPPAADGSVAATPAPPVRDRYASYLADFAWNDGVTVDSAPLRAKFGWPAMPFSEVRAWYYTLEDPHAEPGIPFYVEGKGHHPLAEPAAGIALDQRQTELLLEAIASGRPEFEGAFCYEPHHAFVFFGENREPVAVHEVCFSCWRHRTVLASSPGGMNFVALAKLAGELGLRTENSEGWSAEVAHLEEMFPESK